MLWTADLDTRITELYKNMSATQIAAALALDGHVLSRSAIQGRLHRLGIKMDTKATVDPCTRDDLTPKVRQTKQPPVGSTAYKVIHAIKRNQEGPGAKPHPFVAQLAVDIESRQITLQELTDETCKYGHPWCAAHAAIVWRAPAERKRAA